MKLTYVLHILTIALILVGGALAVNSINSGLSSLSANFGQLNNSVIGLTNNADFSSTISSIDDSVFMIIVQPLHDSLQPFTSAIYLDEKGQFWSKGTGFSVTEDGFIVTAYHVFGDINFTNKKVKAVLKNGETHDVSVDGYFVSPQLDTMILRTNLSLKPVKLAKNVQIPVGAKIGFIGYPLGNTNQIVSDGIISGSSVIATDMDRNYYAYTINSFVNGGNSGGPVFLADTGEVIGIVNAKELAPLNTFEFDTSQLSAETKLILQYQNYLFTQLQTAGQTGIGYSIGVNDYILDTIGKPH